jgi:hypothetical protein
MLDYPENFVHGKNTPAYCCPAVSDEEKRL